MTRYFAVWVLVVLLAGCSTASTVAGRVSTHFPSPKETESPDASYTRQMCGRLEVAIQVRDLREATGIARRMAASGYPLFSRRFDRHRSQDPRGRLGASRRIPPR